MIIYINGVRIPENQTFNESIKLKEVTNTNILNGRSTIQTGKIMRDFEATIFISKADYETFIEPYVNISFLYQVELYNEQNELYFDGLCKLYATENNHPLNNVYSITLRIKQHK